MKITFEQLSKILKEKEPEFPGVLGFGFTPLERDQEVPQELLNLIKNLLGLTDEDLEMAISSEQCCGSCGEDEQVCNMDTCLEDCECDSLCEQKCVKNQQENDGKLVEPIQSLFDLLFNSGKTILDVVLNEDLNTLRKNPGVVLEKVKEEQPELANQIKVQSDKLKKLLKETESEGKQAISEKLNQGKDFVEKQLKKFENDKDRVVTLTQKDEKLFKQIKEVLVPQLTQVDNWQITSVGCLVYKNNKLSINMDSSFNSFELCFNNKRYLISCTEFSQQGYDLTKENFTRTGYDLIVDAFTRTYSYLMDKEDEKKQIKVIEELENIFK